MSHRRKPLPTPTEPPGPPQPRVRIVLPGGTTMALDLAPLAENVTKQDLTFTAVFVDEADRTGQTLEELLRDRGPDPKSGLSEDDCKLVVRTALPRIAFRRVGGFNRDRESTMAHDAAGAETIQLQPPNTELELRFSESDPERQVVRLYSTVGRVRNYFAFFLGQPIPMVALLASGRFLNSIRLDAPSFASAPQDAVQGKSGAAEAWYEAIRTRYQIASDLLRERDFPGRVGRAVSLVGSGLGDSDPEERFFHFWRALEVLANWDLANARAKVKRAGISTAPEYFESVAEPVLSGQYSRVGAEKLISITLKKRLLNAEPLSVKELYGLRTGVAHGELSDEQDVQLLKATVELQALAHSAVSITLDALSRGAPL